MVEVVKIVYYYDLISLLHGDVIPFYFDSILDYGDLNSWYYHDVIFCDDVGLALFKEVFLFCDAKFFCPFSDDDVLVLYENDLVMMKSDVYKVLVTGDAILYYVDPIRL